MTSQPLPVVGVAGSARGVQQRLSDAVDVAMLVGLGWDPDTQVYTPDPSHRLLGYRVCAVVGCGSEAWCRDGLCGGCTKRRSAAPDEPLAAFLAAGMGERRRPGQRLCRVCPQRPAGAANGLCLSCDHLRKVRGQDVAAFIDGDHRYGPAVPRPTTGPCAVLSCRRLVDRPVSGLCAAHHHAWRQAGKPELAVFASTSSPRRGDRKGRVVLRGLPERVITELLLGVQAALREGRRIMPTDLRAVVDHLRDQQVGAVADLDTAGLSAPVRHFLHFTADRARLICSDMASEYDKDVWDLRLWGWKGRLSFVGGGALHRNGRTPAPGIDQSWLKEAAKAWTADALTSIHPATVRTILTAVGLFSEHLSRRPDHGQRPDVLDRVDVEAFLARLAHLQAAGRLTGYSRAQAVDTLARFLRDARAMGLTRPGGPLAGLPDQIAIRARDRSRRQQRREDDTGRALPRHVLTQLLDQDNLDALQAQAGPGWRAVVELMAGVGRRPSELCGLRFDCLDYDEPTGPDSPSHASPVLVYDMPKVAKIGCRLPIHDREAAIITAQQARVRTAFPDTPQDQLVLFPRVLKNPDGAKPVSASGLALTIRGWVAGLPRLDTGAHTADGAAVPFPRERVFPYAFRHTYAQRHADAGTPVDTLKELLGHDTIRTTLGYYRVTAKRKREAAERMGPLQIDAHGSRVRPTLSALTDTEALREQVGQVAVPFGICTEPSNVAADGHSCPFRHRCTGCEYFRTDPSYNPELSTYLAQLLADRERLATAIPELADWARRDAAPSDAQIDSVRRLLAANTEVLAGLDDDDRAAVQAAIATIRTHRAALAATYPAELAGLARQSAPVFFPTIERAAHLDTSHG